MSEREMKETSTTTRRIPVGLGPDHALGALEVCELKGDQAPMLSEEAHHRLKLVIDHDSRTAYSKVTKATRKLHKNNVGHNTINLADYPARPNGKAMNLEAQQGVLFDDADSACE